MVWLDRLNYVDFLPGVMSEELKVDRIKGQQDVGLIGSSAPSSNVSTSHFY